jgi:DNA polymerase III subunit delta
MKYTQWQAFEKHLKEAAPRYFSQAYLILGKDSFERKRAIDRLTAFLLPSQNSPSLGFQSFDGAELKPEQLQQELETFSFFTTKRVLLIQQADKLSKPCQEKCLAYFSHPIPSLTLIFSAPSFPGNSSFYKKAEQVGIVLDIEEEKPWQKEKTMQEWVKTQADLLGKKIENSTSHHLIKQVGTDAATLHQELQKLACYLGSRNEIKITDITAICTGTSQDTIWQLGEALFHGNGSAAMRISKSLLQDGTPFLVLLRQIRTQFQTEFHVCSILANGGTPNDISRQFPYMKGNLLDRHIQMAQNYGLKRFKEALLSIDQADRQAKNSGIDIDCIAEILILNLTR